MRFPLTQQVVTFPIASTYVQNWGAYEAIRELFQNALDAQDGGKPMAWRYFPDEHVLHLTSHGATLGREALLLGASEKAPGEARGQFGEGLKLAMIAALRAGLEMAIVTGGETWVPRFVAAPEYGGREVLAVYIHEAPEFKDSVTIYLKGVTSVMWRDLATKIQALSPSRTLLNVPGHGRVIDEPGRIFSRGLFVTEVAGMKYGYDFERLALDRDRSNVHQHTLWYAARSLFLVGLTRDPATAAALLRPALMDDAYETRTIPEAAPFAPPDSAWVLAIRDDFTGHYGPSAVPCVETADAAEMSHYGYQAIKVPLGYFRTLASAGVDFAARKMRDFGAILCEYTRDQLSAAEQENLQVCLNVARVGISYMVACKMLSPLTDDRIRVVDFSQKGTKALYQPDGKMISLSRATLGSRKEVLISLLHEAAHEASIEHDSTFIHVIHEQVAEITKTMLGWQE